MTIDLADIAQSARELVARHGDRALEIAQELAELASRAGDARAHDVALLVLGEIERTAVDC